VHKLKAFWPSYINYSPGFIVLLVFLSFSLVQADTSRNRGLLWEVTQAGIPASYLFGTIHSEDPEVVRLAAPVQKAFDTSQAVVLEVLLDMNAMMASSAAMLLMDGRSLKDIVGEPLFSKAAAAMQVRGMPEMMTEHMQPWAVAITLSMPTPETGRVLDVVLYENALQAGKQLHGLEAIQEQLDVFATMPLASQVLLLEDAVEHYQDMDALHAQLLSAWKQRDLARLVAINEDALATGDQRFADDFQQRLIVQRNHLMVERMQPYLKQGKTFVAVGALHLPGDKGLLNLLEQQGYTVRAVY
jgi:uncharacterized protein YbaP (TraB family)